jgi:predicted DNA-binding protein YlxM (UPF0122 family)
MASNDKDILAALGVVPTKKIINRLDLSSCLKDRYHHKLSYQAIADKYGVSSSAVYQLLDRFATQLGDPEELSAFKDVEADIQSAIKRRFSSELLSVDLSKTSPKDLATVYGITYDKNRLQTGQSTSNQSVFFSIVSESDAAESPGCIDISPPSE